MGHALNNTLQDILIRWKRMSGFEALWQPGTDHAGIATQNVVEREILDKEKKRRHELGREELVQRIWKWRDQYGDQILHQLKALGASCDWERTRFTFDEGLSEAVRECFVQLYEDGLIYKGKYIVNWCPRCRTALADDEVEHEEKQGNLWHFRYPLVDGSGFIVVATTRPETILGDTAVAVNPKDPRYKHFIGKEVQLPETDRSIPIIADDHVDAAFGSGAVKVTPAHDPNDFQIGARHHLLRINVMNEDATMNDASGKNYVGLTREDCRKKIIKALEAAQLLEKIEGHTHSVGHCYRCNTIIEPWLSDQWFVKMKPLAQLAMEASRKKRVTFHPERWEDFYLQWLENVRDWCISRQIWWGHRIPVWYCRGRDKGECQIGCRKPIVSRTTPTHCPCCESTDLEQDPDVLDTWFSSALWPFSTLGWPEKTASLKTYYPTSTLVTDRGIIFFWVARMVMMGLKMMGKVPFPDVYIHGTILDEQGRKMSKSLGNGIDPLEIIDKYGADAMRFSLVLLSTEGQDLKLSTSKFEMGRNFCNKLWNAARFAFTHLENIKKEKNEKAKLSAADQWILHRLAKVTNDTIVSLEAFHFHEAAQGLYQFVWNDFCDWYLEAIKPTLYSDNAEHKNATQGVLHHVLTTTLRLLHPFMPFITEEIWSSLAATTLMIDKYPEKERQFPYEKEATNFELAKEFVTAIRTVRAEHNVPPKQKITALITGTQKDELKIAEQFEKMIRDLAGVEKIEIGKNLKRPDQASTTVIRSTEIMIPHAGLIDTEAERARLTKETEKTKEEISVCEQKLSNKNFVENAPKQIVDTQRERLRLAQEKYEKLSDALKKI